MSITEEIQLLSPTAMIDLFELDTTMFDGGTVTRFHAGTNALTQPVVWQGNTYYPLPVESEGFDKSTKGTLPRPRIRVANISGVFSAAAAETDDLIGAIVTRKRTFLRYLDAVNFPGGANPTADPNQKLPDDKWYVDQKITENRVMIEWELASAFDLQGVMLPRRQVIQNTCPWQYRGAECSYTGTTMYDSNDQRTSDPNADFCAKRLVSCEKRFPTGTLPYGGFPGAVRHDY